MLGFLMFSVGSKGSIGDKSVIVFEESKGNDHITNTLTGSNAEHRFFQKALIFKNSGHLLHTLKLTISLEIF